jgi:hypothetical protein
MRGEWEEVEPPVPEVIRASGGSALFRCKSTGVAHGIEGSVTYRLAGHPPHHRVRFSWKNRYIGPNTYNAKVSHEEYRIEVEGGGGSHAVVVFIFRMTTPVV